MFNGFQIDYFLNQVGGQSVYFSDLNDFVFRNHVRSREMPHEPCN